MFAQGLQGGYPSYAPQPGEAQMAPQGLIGGIIGQIARPVGAAVGGAFGHRQLGQQIGTAVGGIANLLPFGAQPQAPQQDQPIPVVNEATGQVELVPQGIFSSIIRTVAGPAGGAIGGLLGNRRAGQQVGNIVGTIGGMLPFGASPQMPQHQAQQDQPVPVVNEATGQVELVPQGIFGSIVRAVAGPAGGAIGGMLGNRRAGQQVGNVVGTIGGFLPFGASPQMPQQDQPVPVVNEATGQVELVPQGIFSSIIRTVAGPAGGAIGGLLGNRRAGQQVGNIVGTIGGMLPFGASPQMSQQDQQDQPVPVVNEATGQVELVPQGIFGSIVRAVAGPAGGAIGGLLGNRRAGQQVGNVVGTIGGMLPFGAQPQAAQQAQQDQPVPVVNEATGQVELVPQGIFSSIIRTVAGPAGGAIGGLLGNRRAGQQVGNIVGTIGGMLPFGAQPQEAWQGEQGVPPQGGMLQQVLPQGAAGYGGYGGQVVYH